jgi:hypothetical protein
MEPAGDCRDKVRFRLSDSTGALRFTEFDIVDAPECGRIAGALRDYLLGRPLAEIDLGHIRQMTCAGNGQCIRDIAGVIENSLAMLSPDEGKP